MVGDAFVFVPVRVKNELPARRGSKHIDWMGGGFEVI